MQDSNVALFIFPPKSTTSPQQIYWPVFEHAESEKIVPQTAVENSKKSYYFFNRPFLESIWVPSYFGFLQVFRPIFEKAPCNSASQGIHVILF
jgi:hypothetical protein